jgi:protein phosphatase
MEAVGYLLRYAAATDIGRKRERNEDSFLVVEEDRLFAIADGMGGHLGGHVASRMAVETLGRFFHESRDPALAWPYPRAEDRSLTENRLVTGVRVANAQIFREARGPARTGMGTTIVAAAVVETSPAICVAHVGDSRAYRMHDGDLELLTRDHSMLEEVKALMPEMTAEDERDFAHRNVVTRALGIKPQVDVDVKLLPFLGGDRVLLCSDGLTGFVDDAYLGECMESSKELSKILADLVEEANRAGGLDNITAMVIERS